MDDACQPYIQLVSQEIPGFFLSLTFFEGDEPAVHEAELGGLDEAGLVLPAGRLQLPTLPLPLHLLVPLRRLRPGKSGVSSRSRSIFLSPLCRLHGCLPLLSRHLGHPGGGEEVVNLLEGHTVPN